MPITSSNPVGGTFCSGAGASGLPGSGTFQSAPSSEISIRGAARGDTTPVFFGTVPPSDPNSSRPPRSGPELATAADPGVRTISPSALVLLACPTPLLARITPNALGSLK